MKLFLASEANEKVTIPKIEEFISGFEDKKVAYIPTAQNGHFYDSWKSSNTPSFLADNFADTKVLLLEEYSTYSLHKELSDRDVIWVSGGMAGYLAYWMRRSMLDKLLPELFSNGLTYIGSSSGSMVCSNTLYIAENYIGEPEPGVSFIPGLGLIDFEIYPHYQDELHPQIQELWQSQSGKLYLLKDGEAITVDGDKIHVLGEERVIGL